MSSIFSLNGRPLIPRRDFTCASDGQALISKLERAMGARLRPGRNMLFGIPVDIEDQNPDEGGIAVTPVDIAGLKELRSELRSNGFKIRGSGKHIVIEASNRRRAVSAGLSGDQWLGKTVKLPADPREGIPEEIVLIEDITGGYVTGTVPRKYRESDDYDGLREFPVGDLRRAKVVKMSNRRRAVSASSLRLTPSNRDTKSLKYEIDSMMHESDHSFTTKISGGSVILQSDDPDTNPQNAMRWLKENGISRDFGGVDVVKASNRRHISMSHTSSHTITFSSKSRARKFASKCAALDGCSVKCSGLKVRVRHPIKMSRRVLSAAHRLQK